LTAHGNHYGKGRFAGYFRIAHSTPIFYITHRCKLEEVCDSSINSVDWL